MAKMVKSSTAYAEPGKRLTSFEVCAGGGGLALGMHQAGFDPVLLVDNNPDACGTLSANMQDWPVMLADFTDLDPAEHDQVYDVDVLVAGLPRVKATAAVARPDGGEPELALVKAAALLVTSVQPKALVIENVPDLVTKEKYQGVRVYVEEWLRDLNYRCEWFVVNANEFGVPQDRKQGVLVALKGDGIDAFKLPVASGEPAGTVGGTLFESMASQGWPQAEEWAAMASHVAPTLVGGSEKRGGADLGPRGSKRAWERMGVNGGSLADELPDQDFRWDPAAGPRGMVRLTVAQAALLQGFPPDWRFVGRKTSTYRQVGQSCPPPVGRALGEAVREALAVC
ncbi:DNA cytosine methyltransferase [Amycolatopsis japonica]|uniref:DNA cytosine methyltransferase n=1 Tax=Amycolatopsis japonica TaxID=208439 RepID=UPI0033CC471C